VVCVQKGEHLIIANVGDSKAILFREAALGASSREKCVPNHNVVELPSDVQSPTPLPGTSGSRR
jgi:serine/threonine protein phosphatase PrpC